MTQKFVPKGQSEAPTIKLPEPLEKLFAFFPASLRGKKYSSINLHIFQWLMKIGKLCKALLIRQTF